MCMMTQETRRNLWNAFGGDREAYREFLHRYYRGIYENGINPIDADRDLKEAKAIHQRELHMPTLRLLGTDWASFFPED